MVVCGPEEFIPGTQLDTLLNPAIIIEVLSPGTRIYDQQNKFGLYKDIPSFQQYILIDSEARNRVQNYTRKIEGGWHLEELENPKDLVYLEVLDFHLSLEQIYENTSLDLL